MSPAPLLLLVLPAPAAAASSCGDGDVLLPRRPRLDARLKYVAAAAAAAAGAAAAAAGADVSSGEFTSTPSAAVEDPTAALADSVWHPDRGPVLYAKPYQRLGFEIKAYGLDRGIPRPKGCSSAHAAEVIKRVTARQNGRTLGKWKAWWPDTLARVTAGDNHEGVPAHVAALPCEFKSRPDWQTAPCPEGVMPDVYLTPGDTVVYFGAFGIDKAMHSGEYIGEGWVAEKIALASGLMDAAIGTTTGDSDGKTMSGGPAVINCIRLCDFHCGSLTKGALDKTKHQIYVYNDEMLESVLAKSKAAFTLESRQGRIEKAADMVGVEEGVEYHALSNNCQHFTMDMVTTEKSDVSMHSAWQIFFDYLLGPFFGGAHKDPVANMQNCVAKN